MDVLNIRTKQTFRLPKCQETSRGLKPSKNMAKMYALTKNNVFL